MTRCDKLEHNENKKRKRSIRAKPSIPHHTHNTHKTLEFITQSPSKQDTTTQSSIKFNDDDSRLQTRRDELEHNHNFYPTKKRKRIIWTKLSTPPHIHKNSKTSETITKQHWSWIKSSTTKLITLYNNLNMETQRLHKMFKVKHNEVKYLRSKLNMIKYLATSLPYENS